MAALGAIESAVGDLEAAVDSGLLSSATGNELMDALGGVARGTATEVLDLANSLGGDPGEIADARSLLANGNAQSLKKTIPNFTKNSHSLNSAVGAPIGCPRHSRKSCPRG